MVVQRGEIWWADLDEPRGSEPGFKHPLLILQADAFNRSRLRTVIGVILSSNPRLLDAPGNGLLPAREVGLSRDSVASVTQLVTVDRDYLGERAGRVPPTPRSALSSPWSRPPGSPRSRATPGEGGAAATHRLPGDATGRPARVRVIG